MRTLRPSRSSTRWSATRCRVRCLPSRRFGSHARCRRPSPSVGACCTSTASSQVRRLARGDLGEDPPFRSTLHVWCRTSRRTRSAYRGRPACIRLCGEHRQPWSAGVRIRTLPLAIGRPRGDRFYRQAVGTSRGGRSSPGGGRLTACALLDEGDAAVHVDAHDALRCDIRLIDHGFDKFDGCSRMAGVATAVGRVVSRL
jgi:hypothetical protein